MKGLSLKHLLISIISIAATLFIYVAVLTEIKNLSRQLLSKTELLSEKTNRIEAAEVEIQRLTAEDRIVKFATDSLKMIRPKENLEVITISQNQVNQLEKILNSKYDK